MLQIYSPALVVLVALLVRASGCYGALFVVTCLVALAAAVGAHYLQVRHGGRHGRHS